MRPTSNSSTIELSCSARQIVTHKEWWHTNPHCTCCRGRNLSPSRNIRVAPANVSHRAGERSEEFPMVNGSGWQWLKMGDGKPRWTIDCWINKTIIHGRCPMWLVVTLAVKSTATGDWCCSLLNWYSHCMGLQCSKLQSWDCKTPMNNHRPRVGSASFAPGCWYPDRWLAIFAADAWLQSRSTIIVRDFPILHYSTAILNHNHHEL